MTQFRIHPDRPAHPLDQPLGKGKAQTKASIWGGLVICLKDQGQIVRRNANARVFYRDMHLMTAFPRLQPRNTDQDLALSGELDGIAQKVGQNLPHPP